MQFYFRIHKYSIAINIWANDISTTRFIIVGVHLYGSKGYCPWYGGSISFTPNPIGTVQFSWYLKGKGTLWESRGPLRRIY